MFEKIPSLISKSETISHIGKIENVVGMSMEASGGRSSIGDIVMIYNEEQNRQMPAEVVGFKDGKIQLMTYEATSGIASGSFVRNTRRHFRRSGIIRSTVRTSTRLPDHLSGNGWNLESRRLMD